MSIPKWLWCRATLEQDYGSCIYERYGYRVLGVFIESEKRNWQSTRNPDYSIRSDEVIIG